MKIQCANPGCTQTIHPLSLKIGLHHNWEKKGELWFCSRICFCRYTSEEYIREKRSGARKSIRKAKLGLLLLKNNYIDREQLSLALEEKNNSVKKLGEILVEAGYITEKDLKSVLSIQAGVAPINLDPLMRLKIKDEIPLELINEYHIVIFNWDEKNKIISVALYDMDYMTCLSDYFAQIFPGYLVKFYLEDREKILKILAANFPGERFEEYTVIPTNSSLNGSTITAEKNENLEKAVLQFVDFLAGFTGEEVKVDNLEDTVYLKSETKGLKIDIYLTPTH